MKYLLGYLKTLLLFIGRFKRNKTTESWVAGAGAGLGLAGLGATQLLTALGFSAVTHSSGAAILTGAGGYIAGTFGAAAVITFITAPVAIGLYIICLLTGIGVLIAKRLGRIRA
ncbi:MAG: hypothetical protein KKB02_16520 [Alphaproteobacteria bacterium]|nr:hypothetical protein [Alphaproteobacteria bacterium]